NQTPLLFLLNFNLSLLRIIEFNFALLDDFVENLRQIALSFRLPKTLLQHRDINDFLNAGHVAVNDSLYPELLPRSGFQFLPQHFNRLDGSSSGYSEDRKSTRLNSSHVAISYAVFCLKKKKNID